jgi:hypothetical protein
MTEFSLDPDEFSADHADSPNFTPAPDLGHPPHGIHGNSAPMRAAKQLRSELLAHLGNKPSPVQMAMIDQAAEIKLRLAVMDQEFRKTGRRSAYATSDYLSWANGFVRLLGRLGLKAIPAPGPTLAEILAAAPSPRARTAPAVARDATPAPASQAAA